MQAASVCLSRWLDKDQSEPDSGCGGLPVVRAGETAVEISLAIPGQQGKDVQGTILPVAAVVEKLPEPGEGLEKSDDGMAYVAQYTGYLCLDEDQVWLVPAVWITEDGSAGCLRWLNPANDLPGAAVSEALAQLGVTGRVVLVDVKPADTVERSVRNIPGVRVVGTGRLTARDVVGAGRLVMSKAAVEHLARVLAS